MGAQRLSAQGLVKSYRRRRVVDGVSFDVDVGEVVGLLGPNGAGKSTSFNIVAGLVVADSGRVFLHQHEITRLPVYRRARLGLGYLAQEPSIYRRLTVRQNLLAVLELQPLARRERERRADELIRQFDLGQVAHSFGQSLSGGERRRAEIARTLTARPTHVLFDEPFAGVDPIAVAEIQRIIRDLKQQGIGVLITDHSVRETLGICDRAYLIDRGRILLSGTPEQIVTDERARQVYLGSSFQL
ncbi:MAG: LPS export ABC transporter ATP-binding protein [Deltaproteobacteria bacterium]|nr:LPS export ABC transporter ATP-binding protein [Deltaproteobacteria bacterium]